MLTENGHVLHHFMIMRFQCQWLKVNLIALHPIVMCPRPVKVWSKTVISSNCSQIYLTIVSASLHSIQKVGKHFENEPSTLLFILLFQLNLICTDFSTLLRTLNENTEFDKLAKDSVSLDDDEATSLSREESWISQFLEKVDPLLKTSIDTERSKISRKFFEFIFGKAFFSGDSMLNICLKSDDLKLMERLWAIIYKFEIYELLYARNYNKETCLHLASAMNRAKEIAEMLRCGADVNAVDVDGNTALHVAIQEKNDECVAAILSTNSDKRGKGIDIDLSILNDNGYTALHLASLKNNLNVVKMLNTKAVQAKKLIFDDIEGKHGNSALHIAIESEAREVAEYLIQSKFVNPSKVNKSGHSALYLARVAEATDLVNLMQRHAIIDDQHYMNDEDDASSKDSFESQDVNKTEVII